MKKSIFLLFVLLAINTWQVKAQVPIGFGTEIDKSLPIEPFWGYSYSQVIYLASEINASGDITELTWDFNGTSLSVSDDWTIYMGHTTKSEFTSNSDWIDVSSLTQVFSGQVSINANNKVVVDIADFTYNGTDNLVIAVDENKPDYDGSSNDFYCSSVSGNRSLEYHSDSVNPDPASPPSGTLRANIANIVLGGIQQSCPVPTNLLVANITQTSADLLWTDNTSGSATYLIEWKEANASAWNTITTAAGVSSYQLTGLSPHTSYVWKLTADCGGGDTSIAMSGPDFSSLCAGQVDTFPYEYGFEDLNPNPTADWGASCWSARPHDINGVGYYDAPFRWLPHDTYTPSSYTGPSQAHSGNMYAYTEASSMAVDGTVAELMSPVMDMSTLSSPQLLFYYHMYGSHMGELHVDIFNGNTWTESIWSISGPQQTSFDEPWKLAMIDLPAGVTQIRFRAVFGTGYRSDIAIDDIVIREKPLCLEPLSLQVDQITFSSVQLTWDDTNAGNASYLIEWREIGASNWNSTTTAVGDTSYQLTGLDAATDYEWRVSSDCGSNGTVQAIQGPNFTTLSCPSPTNLSVDAITMQTADLSWTDNTGGNASYVVQWREQGASAWNTGITSAGATSYQITGLNEKTHYEWQLSSNCGNNAFSLPVAGNNFYTWYCESVPYNNLGNGITNVQINGVDFSNPDVTYNDFTGGTVVDMDFNAQTNLYITFDTGGYIYKTNIWIDFNDNLVFEEDEIVFSGASDNNSPTTLDASFTLTTPNVQAGNHIMRIAAAYYGQNTPNPCYNGNYGVTLDFKINVLNSANITDDLVLSDVLPGAQKANFDFIPSAEIYNNGLDTQNDFDVIFTIMDTSNNIVYSDIVNVTGANLSSMNKLYVEANTPANLPEAVYTLNANVSLSGDSNANNNAFSKTINIVDFTYDSGKLYSYVAWDGDNSGDSKHLITYDDTYNINDINDVGTDKFLSSGTFINGVLVAIEYTDKFLYLINGDGTIYEYGQIKNLPNYPQAIAYDATSDNIYISTNNALYKINNLSDLQAVEVGMYPGYFNVLGMDIDNNGNMFVVEDFANKLYSVDKSTAIPTEIGNLGIDIRFSQDITFDPSDGELYGTLLVYDSDYATALYKINTSTAQTDLLSVPLRDQNTIAAIYDYYDPVCIPPTGLSAENITAMSADISWLPGGNETSWEIEFGAPGFAHGDGSLLQVNTNNYQLTGLSPDTSYDVYVRSTCNSINTNWVGPLNIHTFCNVVYIAPYEATFENSGEMQDCWLNEQSNDELDWIINTGSTSTYGTGPSSAYQGDYYLYVETDNAQNGDKAVLFTPKIDISGFTSPQLSFYYNMYGTGMEPDASIQVFISNDDGNNYVQIFEEQGNHGSQWQEALVDLTAYSGIVSFKIVGTVSSSGIAYQNDFAIDEFKVLNLDDMCMPPTNIVTENYTNDSVDLSWNPGGNEQAWQIEYGLQGFAQGSGTIVDVTSNTYTLTGLNANASYDVYVRAICGANPTFNNNSEWVGPLNFNLGFGCYGPSTFSDTTGDWISHVSLNTIDNNSGQGGAGSFENYKNISTELQLGTAYDISVSVEVDGNWNQQVWAFVDWNHDCDFDDAGEAIDLGEVNGSGVVDAIINVPPDAVLGETVIRIIEQSAVDPQPYNMHESIYGETEDYTLIIIDTIPPQPVDSSLPNIVAQCEVTTLTPPLAIDNSSNTVTVTHDATLPINTLGVTLVTWTYDDGNGNTSTQIQFVTIADSLPPVPDAAELPDITAECEVTSLTPPTATDNCGGNVTVTHDATLPITTQGTTVVTWTYDDGRGNTVTQQQNVIIDDVTPPVPDVAILPDITAECEVTSLTPPTATDACAGTITATHNISLPVTQQGVTVVTWTYDDGNGNTIEQYQNIVIEDVTPPVPDVAVLPDVTAECEVTLTPPVATDNCAGSITATSDVEFPVTVQGTTVVTWTYDDGNGNITTQQQNIIIDDVTPPVPDLSNLPDVVSECELTDLTPPAATDNCSANVTVTHDATLPITTLGTTVVTWTYDDGNGNTFTQQQNVIIEDATPPVPDVAILPDITAECEVTSLTPPTATDACAGTITATHNISLPVTQQGVTVVTWTYDDGNGNTIEQYQNIVIEDVTPPAPDVAVLPDVTAECEVTLTPPVATDNCAGSITATSDVEFPVTVQGTTVVTWTYDDGNGNITTQQQNIIIDDVTPPVPELASLPDVVSECELTELTPPAATDNCSANVTVTHDATLPITTLGTTVVTWTYDDGNGNTFTQQQNVIIVDSTPPVPDVAILPDITAECEVTSLTPPTATDACAGTITATHNISLPVTQQGVTVVTWTYDDGNGNTFVQYQNIIIDDVTPPVPDVAQLDDIVSECEVTDLTPPTATDNCSTNVSVTHDVSLPVTTPGTTVITWTFEDENGNISTQTQNIIITPIDNTVSQSNNVLTANASGNYTYQWGECSNGTFVPINGETGQSFTATQTGDYAVEISNGTCSVMSDCIYVEVNSVVVEEMKDLKIYPNPSTGLFFIEIPEYENTSVSIYDMTGKLILHEELRKEKTQLDIQKFARAIYILRVQKEDKVYNINIIKK